MTLKEYLAFVTSVETGSLSKAAEKLGATQSGVTHLILNMEKELGFSVMTRNKSGVTLTKEGSRIFQTAKDIVNANEKVLSISSKIRGETSNKINIATFTSVAINWLPNIINGYQALHPDVEITITDGNYHDIKIALDEGVADVGFVSLPFNADYKFYPLVKEKIYALLPINHPLKDLSAFPVERFAVEPVISLPDNTDIDYKRVYDEVGITPNIKYRTNDDHAMISMVENNLGICLEPELLLKGRHANVKILETIPPSFRTIALAVPYEKQASPLTLDFAEYIIKWVKENCHNAI